MGDKPVHKPHVQVQRSIRAALGQYGFVRVRLTRMNREHRPSRGGVADASIQKIAAAARNHAELKLGMPMPVYVARDRGSAKHFEARDRGVLLDFDSAGQGFILSVRAFIAVPITPVSEPAC